MPPRFQINTLPLDWPHPQESDLAQTTCVVIDVIRATSTITAGLAAGFTSIKPFLTVEEAYAEKTHDPEILLAGERHGLQLEGFDFGNSPQRFNSELVQNRRLALTTTNGTAALLACRGAKHILAASLLNLSAVVTRLLEIGPPWRIVCAGRGGHFALDDTLVAGLIAERLDEPSPYRALYRSVANEIRETLRASKSGAGLVKIGLGQDVDFCAQLDLYPLVPHLQADGLLRIN